MKIDKLADEVLLYVFDFYLADTIGIEAWHTLVHVCRRWRLIVFSSPRRLNLRIACSDWTLVTKKLNVWPPSLPIVVLGSCDTETCYDNIKAALGHHNRVCQIDLTLTAESEDVFEMLGEPFPKLTVLKLDSTEIEDPVFPTSGQYFGGTTRLRSLSLLHIPIPRLPSLLLSSTDLVDLRLIEIPSSVFISPDKMATALSALTKLQLLHLGTQCDKSHPDWENRRLHPLRPTVLPSLTELRFEGSIVYLEDLMARIDAPLLDRLDIVVSFHLNPVIVFDAPQILRFISHVPKLQELSEAHIGIGSGGLQVWVDFLSTRTPSALLKLEILCFLPEQQFPYLAQFFRSPFFPLPTLEYLYFDRGTYSRLRQRDDMDIVNTRWLELLQPFVTVKNLYLSKDFAQHITTALLGETLGEGEREVLPALENIFIEKLPYQPTSTRRLSGHPILFSDWVRTGREERLWVDM